MKQLGARGEQLVEDKYKNLGFKLLDRVGRSVKLTQQGREVFEHCRKIFGQVDQLKADVGRLGKDCRGPLNFAAAEPIASCLVPEVLETFLKENPAVWRV